MNGKDRLQALLDRLRAMDGLEEDRFQRMIAELERQANADGCDEKGRLKVAVYDAKSYDVQSFNEQNQSRYALHYIQAGLNRDTVTAADGFRVICIFVNDVCDAAVVESLAALGVQLIALRCAGYNNVDLEACRRHRIDVVRVPGYSPYAVAEHTVALMLMLNRHLHQAYQRNRAGYFVLEGLIGFDMRGKTVGVVGTGRIGRCTIDILRGFGCQILAYDKFRDPELLAAPDVRYVELDELFACADIVTLHVPLFPETKHLINQAAIESMKDGVMVINTSRGGLVDTRTLIHGLKSGKIGSAGLDVYEEEAGIFFTDMSDKILTDDVLARLMTFNNVVVTSHQAFLTRKALANIAETTFGNVGEFELGKRGGELTNAVSVG